MTAAAARYGASLFELAAEERLDERILQELDCAAGCIAAEPAYVRLLSAPNIPRRERRALLDEAFATTGPMASWRCGPPPRYRWTTPHGSAWQKSWPP